jgi:LuxR family maltose regulon positive regulatory protein
MVARARRGVMNAMANDHILATKLVTPGNSSRMVERPRLLLPQSTRRLVLVSAPAGYGKTTLLAAWTRDSEAPVAWLSLDTGDNDPTRFLMHFITAIQTRFPDLGQVVVEMLGCTPPAPVAGLMRTLVNQLCALPDRLCIVLDDLHLVTDAAVHEAIAFLVDHQPPQLQLIFAGRSDPPFSLARIRGQGQLLEYRAADLRFTLEEAERFCNEVMHFGLPANQIETLAARTEGWIVGLQLAAVSLRTAPDKGGFIDSFAGDNRHITDFLLDEVLRSCSPEVQDFLLHTSLLERFNAPLCDAVTGREDSRAMIDEMERSNMFLVGLDHQRVWYRYHHLFTSLLQSRLRIAQPALVDILQRRASKWFSENGYISESINHAIRAADFEFAADLMERHGGKLFSHGQVSTVLSWADQLPQPLLLQRPGLSIMCAWGSFYMDNLNALDKHIHTVSHSLTGFENAPFGSKERTMIGQLAIMRGCRLAYTGRLDGAISYFKEALNSIPPERTLFRAGAVCLGVQYFVAGEMDKAKRLLEEHSSITQVKFNVLVPITAVLGLARLHLLHGNLAAARQVYDKAMRECTASGWQDFPACGMLHIGLGELAYEMNDLARAEHHLNRGVDMTAVGMQYVNTWGRILLAQTRAAQHAEAGNLPAQSEALLLKYSGRFVADVPPLSAAIGRFRLQQEKLDAVAQWVDAANLPLGRTLERGREPEYLVLARYRIVCRQNEAALELLDRLWRAAQQGRRLRYMIEIRIMQALAHHARGAADDALDALREAVTLSEHTGLLRVFLDEGAVLAGLLKKLARGADYTSHVYHLLNRIANLPAESKPADPLPMLFSKKEKQVVGHIVGGSSNQEIAEALFISANTLNSHMKSIYSKLGVNSRLQAVERLRKLGVEC